MLVVVPVLGVGHEDRVVDEDPREQRKEHHDSHEDVEHGCLREGLREGKKTSDGLLSMPQGYLIRGGAFKRDWTGARGTGICRASGDTS